MQGLMMDCPLRLSSLLTHAATYYPTKGVISRTTDGKKLNISYRDIERRTQQLADWLTRLGVTEGDRVGTLAWNTHRHMELYYATSGMGAVCHTINPRLSPEEIAYILNDAGTEVVFFDSSFASLVEAVKRQQPPVKIWIQLSSKENMLAETHSDYLCYEEGLESGEGFTWPEFEETRAAGLCYTSGTTGKPKGVLYSHRSTVLHALSSAAPNVLDIAEHDIVMPVVPMFHVNAWGIPHVAPIAGADLVLPGPTFDGEGLAKLLQETGTTFAAGVPTIWHGLWTFLDKSGFKLPELKRCIVGGAALPEAMIRFFEDDQKITMFQGWGMTETSPICTISKLSSEMSGVSRDDEIRQKARQGRAVFPVQMKILDDAGSELPWNDEQSGELYVQGPWIAKSYFGHKETAAPDNWFPTGDISKIDSYGSMKITDRAKDIIKSGGEWISSLELEDAAMSHPAIQQAAVIGVKDARWDERPLMVYIRKPDTDLSPDSLKEHLSKILPKWKVPQVYVETDSLPLGATGKILKTKIREQYNTEKSAF